MKNEKDILEEVKEKYGHMSVEQQQMLLLQEVLKAQDKARHNKKVLIFWLLGFAFLIFFQPLLIPWFIYGVVKLLGKGFAKGVEIGKRDQVWIDKLGGWLDKW